MAKIWLDHSDGRYYTRQLTDEEAADHETKGFDVVYIEDTVWETYLRDCNRDAIWQALWRSISNEQYMRRREKELRPLEDAEREIRKLEDELEQARRMWKHFENETTRVRSAVRDHIRARDEWTCVFPQPGCDIAILPPAWRERAQEILTKYKQSLADEGMRIQGCCCGNEHQRLHDATVIQLRAAGFIVEHDSELEDA
jgi:hypothetical protein